MNSDIQFLRTLEEDLEEAAAHESEREAASSRMVGAGSPRRGLGIRRWLQVAAAVVALLVIAGGIGILAQRPPSRPVSGAEEPAARGPEINRQQSVVHGPALGGIKSSQPIAAPILQPRAASAGSSQIGSDQAQASGSDLSKIVRTGSITVQVGDGTFTKTAVPAVYKVAADAGGFVLSSSTKSGASGTFTLRIPSRHFDSAMTALAAIGTVQASESAGKDVTSQYVDYKARLRILNGRRTVVLGLLSKATTIAQTLELQSEFDKVELQIEQYRGQLNVLRNQVTESTIQVDVAEKDSPKPAPAAQVHTPSLRTSLGLGWQGFVRVIGAVLVGLGYLIPVAAIAGVIWGITVWARRRRGMASAS